MLSTSRAASRLTAARVCCSSRRSCVERELPLNAHLDGQLADLRERLESATAVAGSYGVAVRKELVRTRPGSLGEEVARCRTPSAGPSSSSSARPSTRGEASGAPSPATSSCSSATRRAA